MGAVSLGMVMRRVEGWRWMVEDDGWGVEVDEEDGVVIKITTMMPMTKVVIELSLQKFNQQP